MPKYYPIRCGNCNNYKIEVSDKDDTQKNICSKCKNELKNWIIIPGVVVPDNIANTYVKRK